MPITRPVNLQKPFANTGGKNTIPNASQIGVTPGAASYEDGFPPLTRTPLSAGGVPPFGQDMNGVLFDLSQHVTFLNAGGRYRFDAALSTAIGGYPVGFILQDNSGVNEYINVLANNTTDFNSTPASIGVSWIPYGGLFTSLKTASGYQKFPGGVLLQWGGGTTVGANGATGTVFSFPIAFPTACLRMASSDSGATDFVISTQPTSVSALKGWARDVTGGGAYGSATFNYLAIGF